MTLPADVMVYLDPTYSTDGKDIQLTVENLSDPDFPKPKNQLPVLFIHGRDLENGKSFRKHWQQPFNNLPCFRETLQMKKNAWLDIEPYYIDLEDFKDDEEKKNRSIEEDARKIEEAVKLILLHQGAPEAKAKKVVIIAYGRGAIGARYYLKDLWEKQNKQLSFHPVSEFIAISPPNHGLNIKGDFQLTSRDFIEKLNGHPLRDTMKTNDCGQVFDSEAPGSRMNHEAVEKGILYVTLYAKGNRAAAGGGDPSDDARGQVMAKNLAPNAVNIEVPGIPGGNDKTAVHQNTVHMPEVICKALYTAVHHQAPPDDLVFKRGEEKDRLGPPIVPQLQIPKPETGIVLLLDISDSMVHLLPSVKRAVESFMHLLSHYRGGKANFGMVVFPPLPWSVQKDCGAQVLKSMAPVTETGMENIIKTVNCLKAQGDTPLLKGIDTALQMFGNESRKVILLLGDGNHNCPSPVNVNTGDAAVKNRIKHLDEKQVTIYAVGISRDIDGGHTLLRKLAADRKQHLKGKFLQVTEPGTTLTKAVKSIFFSALELEEGEQVTMKPGFDKTTYETGDIITVTAAVTEGERRRPVTGLADMTVIVTRPVEGPGNWFALNKVGAEALETIPGTIGAESISLLDRKTIFLTQKRRIMPPRKSGPVVLPLYDDGSRGDKKRGDGIYTNQYKDTLKEGTYSFRFRAARAGGDSFEQEKEEQVYVTVKPDPGYSPLDIQWRDVFPDQPVQYLYDVESVPKDRYGNHMGPGHMVEAVIVYKDNDDSRQSFRLKDHLDGTYKGETRISRAGFKSGVRLVFTIDGNPFTTVEKIPGFKKWSLGLHAGTGIPVYSFKRDHDPRINFGCHVLYHLAPHFSLAGVLGYNDFKSYSSSTGDTRWWNISANLKSEITKNPFGVYINAGAGIYIPKAGDLKQGFNFGAGAAYSLKSNYAIELGADFHLVNTIGINSSFLVTYARLLYRL